MKRILVLLVGLGAMLLSSSSSLFATELSYETFGGEVLAEQITSKPAGNNCGSYSSKQSLLNERDGQLIIVADRSPNCCGQCTTDNGYAGCWIDDSDGNSYCSSC